MYQPDYVKAYDTKYNRHVWIKWGMYKNPKLSAQQILVNPLFPKGALGYMEKIGKREIHAQSSHGVGLIITIN